MAALFATDEGPDPSNVSRADLDKLLTMNDYLLQIIVAMQRRKDYLTASKYQETLHRNLLFLTKVAEQARIRGEGTIEEEAAAVVTALEKDEMRTEASDDVEPQYTSGDSCAERMDEDTKM